MNHHEGKSISTSIARIENIRASVDQMKDVNKTLETYVNTYEVTFPHEEQMMLQKKISGVIERGNAVAASSRVKYSEWESHPQFCIQTLKLEYNNRLRGSMTTSEFKYHNYLDSLVTGVVCFRKPMLPLHTPLSKISQSTSNFNSATRSCCSRTIGELPFRRIWNPGRRNRQNRSEPNSFVPCADILRCRESPSRSLISLWKRVWKVKCSTGYHQFHFSQQDCFIGQEIEKIQKSMKDIQQMFFDLALLVDEQGEMLDYIQINVSSNGSVILTAYKRFIIVD